MEQYIFSKSYSNTFTAIQVVKENEEILFNIFPGHTIKYNLLNPDEYLELPKYGDKEIGYLFEVTSQDLTAIGTLAALFNSWIIFKKGRFKKIVTDKKFKRKYEFK